jgi:hypothetical protein
MPELRTMPRHSPQKNSSRNVKVMPTEPSEEELEKEIDALKSGKFRWIKPGGFIDMTKSRIKELTKK